MAVRQRWVKDADIVLNKIQIQLLFCSGSNRDSFFRVWIAKE
jgi:hypothetical protein